MNKSICYNQTQEADQRNHDLALARIATSLICLLLTFPILALVCARRLFKTATQRQYLYLVLATQAYLIALAAGVDKIFTEYATHDNICAALGFLTQWASITELFFTFSVIVFLQLAILRKHQWRGGQGGPGGQLPPLRGLKIGAPPSTRGANN